MRAFKKRPRLYFTVPTGSGVHHHIMVYGLNEAERVLARMNDMLFRVEFTDVNMRLCSMNAGMGFLLHGVRLWKVRGVAEGDLVAVERVRASPRRQATSYGVRE